MKPSLKPFLKAEVGAASGTGISVKQLGQLQTLLLLECTKVAAAPVPHLQLQEAPVHRAPARPLLPELPDQELPAAVHSGARIQGFVIQEPWEGKGTGWLIPTADPSLPSGETTGKSEQLYPGWTRRAGTAGLE